MIEDAPQDLGPVPRPKARCWPAVCLAPQRSLASLLRRLRNPGQQHMAIGAAKAKGTHRSAGERLAGASDATQPLSSWMLPTLQAPQATEPWPIHLRWLVLPCVSPPRGGVGSRGWHCCQPAALNWNSRPPLLDRNVLCLNPNVSYNVSSFQALYCQSKGCPSKFLRNSGLLQGSLKQSISLGFKGVRRVASQAVQDASF